MYEAAVARPEGDATVSRLAATAAAYGYEGIVVRNHDDARPSVDLDRVREAHGVDVVDGTEIRADDRSAASARIDEVRERRAIVLVRGGTPSLNRFAVERERVDVLAAPMDDDGDFDHVLARAAADNGVRIEFDFGPVLRSDGGLRVRALSSLRKLREIVEAYDAPFVVSARPRSHLQFRAPRELRALGEAIGFDGERVDDGLAEWGRLAARNRERLSDEFIAPGVELRRHEEDR